MLVNDSHHVTNTKIFNFTPSYNLIESETCPLSISLPINFLVLHYNSLPHQPHLYQGFGVKCTNVQLFKVQNGEYEGADEPPK